MQNCKYNLIKNEITNHLEKEFPNEQYWCLDCGEWGYAIINPEDNYWHSAVSNGADFNHNDLNELCEESIKCLIENLDQDIEDFELRLKKDNKELEKAKYLVKTLPLIIQNTEQNIARLKGLKAKKTPTTAEQIIKTLLQ